MREKWPDYLGACLNAVMISAPLIFVDTNILFFFSHPNTWLFYLMILAFGFAEGHASRWATYSGPKSTEKPFLPYLSGIAVLIVFWIAVIDHASDLRLSLLQSLIATAAIASGIAIRFESIRKLKENFLPHIGLSDKHQLITGGIYSVTRHPSEFGLLLICIGVAVLLSSERAFFITALIVLPISAYRMSLEDALLRMAFSDEFQRYKLNTPALIPRLGVLRRQ